MLFSFIRRSTLIVGSASLIVSSFCSAKPSYAALINGSFETGDTTGWTTIGNTPVEAANATDGVYSIQPSTVLSFPGRQPAASASDLEAFLGLSSGSLSRIGNGTAIRGSAIEQTFTADVGDVLSFDWNFGTFENTSDPNVNDFAFVELGLDNSLGVLANTKYPNFIPLIIPGLSEGKQTGFKTFSFTIPDATIYTLGIGVIKVGDGVGDSGLFIDNVKLTSTAVPEPSSALGTLTLGVLAASVLLKNKQRRKC